MYVTKSSVVLLLLAVSIVTSRKTVRVLEKAISRPSYNCPQKNKRLDVVFKNDYHTNRYYRCILGTAYEFQCPEEAMFDPSRRRCQRSTGESRWFLYNTNSLVHTEKCHSGVRFVPVGKISPRYLLCIGDGIAKEKLCPRAYSNGKSLQLLWMGDHCDSVMLDDEVVGAGENSEDSREYDFQSIKRHQEDRMIIHHRNPEKRLKCESVVMPGSSKAIQTDCFYQTNHSNEKCESCANDGGCLCKHNSKCDSQTTTCDNQVTIPTTTPMCSTSTLPTTTSTTTEQSSTSTSTTKTETTTTTVESTGAPCTTTRKPLTRCYCVEVNSSEEASDQMTNLDDSSKENIFVEFDALEDTSYQLDNVDDSSREKRFVYHSTAANATLSNNSTISRNVTRYRVKELPVSYFKINFS
ncbi:AAEL007440-PA [Aedes aegypti]|uniref:AAEL007440-PA n=1 Tax=Aedes aegypti TaxID=7159 RepID=Q172C1_AEDAE|nr:AAEL007440-PA [Aedes aegypti]